MLHAFLDSNRAELIARCRAKVGARSKSRQGRDLPHGISLFLDQLIETLRLEETSQPMESRLISGPASGRPAPSMMGDSAALHARELLGNGYTVDEVVHDYGDLCQAVTSLAFEQACVIDTDEFRTFNRCLDNVIAVAVTEFAYQRDTQSATNLRGCSLVTSESPDDLAIAGDRDLLMAAVGNLLQNAFKFTRPRTEVRLHAYAIDDRVYIDVSDHCGGLPEGAAENLFTPFVQAGANRSGAGLGLSISRRSVEANGGTLGVRNVPGTGCVFTISLPRQQMPVLGDPLTAAQHG